MKMYFLLKIVIFHCPVSLPEGNIQIQVSNMRVPNRVEFEQLAGAKKLAVSSNS